MAEIPFSLDEAQRLYDKGHLTDDQFAKIQTLVSPVGAEEAGARLRTQLQNPTFAPSSALQPGGTGFTDAQIAEEGQKRAMGSANALVSSARQKEASEEMALQRRAQAGDPTAQAPIQNASQTALAPQGEMRPAVATPQDMQAVQATPVLASDTQQLVTPQVNPYEQIIQQANKPYELQAQGVMTALKAGEAKALEQQAYFDRIQKEDAARLAASQANEAERQAKIDARLADLDKRATELATAEVDPNRYWANKSTGDKIMAGIGLFLGAFGRNGNQAANIIQNAVQQDIDAQKANFAQKKDQYMAQKGVFGEMMSVYKDQKLAEEASRLAYLSNAQIEVGKIAAKYSGQEAQAKAQELMGQIEAQKQQTQLAIVGQLQKMYPQQVASDANPEMLDEKQRARFVPGFGLALTPEDAKDFKQFAADNQNAKDGVRQLMELSTKVGKSISVEDRAKAETVASMLQGSLRTQILGPGAVSDNERKLLERIVANPTAIFSLDDSTKKRLQTLMETLDRNLNNKAKLVGLKTPQQELGLKPIASK